MAKIVRSVELDAESLERLNELRAMTGMTQRAMISRTLCFCGRMPDEAAALILGTVPQSMEEFAVERFCEALRRGDYRRNQTNAPTPSGAD